MNHIRQFFLALASLGILSAEPIQVVCGNLVYGKNQTSVCFADNFLADAIGQTGLDIAPRFARIKLDSDEVFKTPFCVFTGEGDFQLSQKERENLKRYVMNGGFIIACPGCSDSKWNKAFRREIAAVLPAHPVNELAMDHELFSMVHQIDDLKLRKSSGTAKLYGISVNKRLAVLYSPEGLNNASNAKGCCCCGGNEIKNSLKINVNALIYALVN